MLSRLLFFLTLVIALILLALVGFVPQFPVLSDESAFIHLFANDLAVRRTAVVCAIGLVVTAFIFFRAPHNQPAPVKNKN